MLPNKKKKFSKIWGGDPRSGIGKKPIPDPGYRGQKGTGSGSVTQIQEDTIFPHILSMVCGQLR